jgi:hypothetical protein
MRCSLIPHEFVNQVWDEVKDFLNDAAHYTYGRYDINDIYEKITEYGYNLWIAFDDDNKIKGAVVTNFAHYPKKKYLVMTYCGGVDLEEWKSPMLKLLQQYAFDTGCDGVEATARLGWAKIFKNDGHIPLWQTFQLPAADAGLGA